MDLKYDLETNVNLVSFESNRIKISFIDGYYYIKNLKWRFYHRKAGVYFYLLGINRRISFLKKKYFLNKINFDKDDIIIDCGANNGDLFLCFDKRIKLLKAIIIYIWRLIILL